MNKCADLLPDHFSFVKGMVDSEDLSLNISREMLQHDRQLKLIAKTSIKIKAELKSLLKNKREKYESFYESFGRQLKFGVYNDFGANKDVLKDLLLFYSSKEKKLVTLDEYVSRMPEDQNISITRPAIHMSGLKSCRKLKWWRTKATKFYTSRKILMNSRSKC